MCGHWALSSLWRPVTGRLLSNCSTSPPPPPPSEQDVWSLGVVLFAAVAGFLPFHSSTGDKKELCNKIIEGR